MNVLVSGAGGPAGVCTIKALKGKHRLVAVDMDAYASGLYLADKAYRVPPSSDQSYLQMILEICQRENVSLIIPTVSEELALFAKNLAMFKAEDVQVAVSNEKSIAVANNKLETYRFFKGEPYCPQIYDEETLRFPCVVKPCDSRGSRGFYVCNGELSLSAALESNRRQFGGSIVMEYLQGEEYSVYGLSDLKGQPLLSVVNRRIKARGESTVAEVVVNPKVSRLASLIARQIGMVGPWDVQLMGKEGNYKIVEVNPRIAGSTALVIASGIDYVGLVIKVFTNQKISQRELTCQSHPVMIRYNEEIFLEEDEILGDRFVATPRGLDELLNEKLV